jgi:hypothetical protein
MVPGEDGVGEVVEALEASLALIALTVRLGVISSVLDGRGRGATGTSHAVRPPHIPDGLVALGVVEEVLDIYHRETPRDRLEVGIALAARCRRERRL